MFIVRGRWEDRQQEEKGTKAWEMKEGEKLRVNKGEK